MHPIPIDPKRVADLRTPIMLIVDDPAPVVHVYRCHIIDVHHEVPISEDGRPLAEEIPNKVLAHFADVIQRWGIRLADCYLSRNGRTGAIRESLDAGGWPILVTHWQSLFSNGLETGLAVLDEVGQRVQEQLCDEVIWCSASEVMERTIKTEEPSTSSKQGNGKVKRDA